MELGKANGKALWQCGDVVGRRMMRRWLLSGRKTRGAFDPTPHNPPVSQLYTTPGGQMALLGFGIVLFV